MSFLLIMFHKAVAKQAIAFRRSIGYHMANLLSFYVQFKHCPSLQQWLDFSSRKIAI